MVGICQTSLIQDGRWFMCTDQELWGYWNISIVLCTGLWYICHKEQEKTSLCGQSCVVMSEKRFEHAHQQTRKHEQKVGLELFDASSRVQGRPICWTPHQRILKMYRSRRQIHWWSGSEDTAMSINTHAALFGTALNSTKLTLCWPKTPKAHILLLSKIQPQWRPPRQPRAMNNDDLPDHPCIVDCRGLVTRPCPKHGECSQLHFAALTFPS